MSRLGVPLAKTGVGEYGSERGPPRPAPLATPSVARGAGRPFTASTQADHLAGYPRALAAWDDSGDHDLSEGGRIS